MTLLQLILLGVSAYFAYQVYQYVQNLQDPADKAEGNFLKDDNFDPQPLIDEADRAVENEQWGKAKALLSEADVKAPHNAQVIARLAYVLAKEGEEDRAISYYEESLKLEDNDMVHNAVASLYRKKGDFDRAREHYEAALAIDPEYDVTYFNYGNLLMDMGEKEKAKEMYAKAVEINPDFMQAKFELEKLS